MDEQHIEKCTDKKCIRCKKYYACNSGYCSVCYKYKNSKINYYEYIKRDHTDEEIDYLYKNKCSHYEDNMDCMCCLNSTRCFSKFACKCIPTVCIECKDNIQKCPLCHSPMLLEFTPDHLKILIKGRFTEPSIVKFAKYVCQFNGYDGDIFKFEQCIMKANVMLDTMTPYYHNTDLCHNSYDSPNYFLHVKCWSLVFDFWNVPKTLPTSVPNFMFCNSATPSSTTHNFICANDARKKYTNLFDTVVRM